MAPAPVPSSSNAADTKPVPEPEKSGSQPSAAVSPTADAVEPDDLPSVVTIITTFEKLIDDLAELDPADLTNDQKWNLTRAFDDISEWFGNHEQSLKLPGQL